MTTSDPRDQQVHGQYESYPYPERDPADERRRLVSGSPSHLDEIRHYIFAGRLDLSRPFRALIAGGGTGDAAIMLAQHLADANAADAEVTHLDISSSSQGIARRRAEVRGLDNLRFVSGRIEDVADHAPGPYDYIDCCGVLHHLADPETGLRALRAQLSDTGGMGLMVYGALGRTGVYPVQEALATLVGDRPDAQKVMLARRLVDGLAGSHWLKRNPFVGDHLAGDDAGLYDLLLHSRDRAYRVLDLVDLLQTAGLEPRAWIEPARYTPATYLADAGLRRTAESLDPVQQAALAEQLSSVMAKHIVYAMPAGRSAAPDPDPGADGTVLVLRDLDPTAVAQGLKGRTLEVDIAGTPYRAPLPALAGAIVGRLDGVRSVAEIRADIKHGDPERFAEQVRTVFAAFHGINRMLIRRAG